MTKTSARTIDLPLADGRTETVLAKNVGSMWWAMDKETGIHHTMVSVSSGPRRDVYTTALEWADAVLRVWEEKRMGGDHHAHSVAEGKAVQPVSV